MPSPWLANISLSIFLRNLRRASHFSGLLLFSFSRFRFRKEMGSRDLSHSIISNHRMPARNIARMQKSWPALTLWVTKRKIQVKTGETIISEGVPCGKLCVGNTTLTLLKKCVPRVTYKLISWKSKTFPPKCPVIYGPRWGNSHLFHP